MKFEYSTDEWGNQVVTLKGHRDGASAKVVADSISPTGHRLTTPQERFWRPVLAERNTATIQKKNSASSRAIPLEKMMERFKSDPANPISWPAEQKGMQGGADLKGQDLLMAASMWGDIKYYILTRIEEYVDDLNAKYGEEAKQHRLHKGHINRLLEFGQWHVDTVTATGWENWFEQRCTPLAMPEIAAVAECVREAMRISEPTELGEGQWHLPYIRNEDHEEAEKRFGGNPQCWHWLTRISAARVARTSYLTMDGKRDYEDDIRLYSDVLIAGPHWSPLEQVATPDPWNTQTRPYVFSDVLGRTQRFEVGHLPRVGPFPGWRTLRTEVETEMGVVTYR